MARFCGWCSSLLSRAFVEERPLVPRGSLKGHHPHHTEHIHTVLGTGLHEDAAFPLGPHLSRYYYPNLPLPYAVSL